MFRLFQQVAEPKMAGSWPFLFDSLYRNKKVPVTPEQEEKIISSLEDILARCTDSNNQDDFNTWSAKNAGARLARHYQRIESRQDVERVVRKYGGAYEFAAAAAHGLAAVLRLQEITEDYRRYGMIADAERTQIAGTAKGNEAVGGMKGFKVAVDIPKEKIDAFLDELTAGNVVDSLTRIATYFIPRSSEARDVLKMIQKEHPFLALIGRNRLSAGHIVASAGSIEADPDGRLYFQLAEMMAYRAPFLHAGLDSARARHNMTADDIVAFLYSSPVFEPSRKALIKHGLESYLKGDHIAAVHILLPQIEQGLRVLLGLLGVPINKAGRTGMHVKNLNDILREPEICSVLGDDTTTYFLVFLADARGNNVRNDVSHGLFAFAAFRQDVADRVVHCLLVLGLLRNEPDASTAEADA